MGQAPSEAPSPDNLIALQIQLKHEMFGHFKGNRDLSSFCVLINDKV